LNPIRAFQDWHRQRRLASPLGVDRRALSGGGVVPAAPILSGTFVTPESALSLAAVYAAVNVISRDIAIMPRNTYKKLKGGGKEVAEQHPTHNLVRWQADDDVDAMRFFQTLMGHVLTRGNGYAEIERDLGDGSPQALHILHPVKTVPMRTKAGNLYYELDGDPLNRLAPENCLHFAGMGFDGIRGYSPITVARQTIGLGIAVEQFGAAYFGNANIPKGMLKIPKRLSETALNNLRSTFGGRHQGSQNAHNIAILEEGTDWINTPISAEDGQFLQTRKFQVEDIARLYSIPPQQDRGLLQ
jgi:HK97 family phage portal protein